MQEQALTEFHRKRLEAETARAREAVRTATETARKEGPGAGGYSGDKSMSLYHKAGSAAFFFCIWFAFIAPIALILANWD
jgi:hypothetical protein